MVKSRFYEFVEGNEKYEVENVINENFFCSRPKLRFAENYGFTLKKLSFVVIVVIVVVY